MNNIPVTEALTRLRDFFLTLPVEDAADEDAALATRAAEWVDVNLDRQYFLIEWAQSFTAHLTRAVCDTWPWSPRIRGRVEFACNAAADVVLAEASHHGR
eukprot:TRINITY_DN51374_c0_g1_i3.p1 TRINITY_DN51374_c0_g1~~TRINITY_DN51374_c0_g1_i3.p1  ORF type:complete len:100 (+),score=3.69 TRINITY_DN51374_c0_g1_i3:313-612(+)